MAFKSSVWLSGLCLVAWSVATPVSKAAWQEPPKKPAAQEKEEAEPPANKDLEQKACGPKDEKHSAKTDKNQHPKPEPPADKALVYVIRPTMMGNKVQTKLAVDQKWVGVNRGDNYFFLLLAPGEHYFCSQAENHSVLALKMEAGKTYYLQQKIRMGFMKAGNKLVQLDEAEGKAGLAKTHLSIFEEKGKD